MTIKDVLPTFQLHDPVEINGRMGTVVDAYPGADSYTVEIFDEDGDTVDVIVCRGRQLRQRSTNGSAK